MKRDYESRLEALYTEYYGNGGCQFFRECEKGISKSCMFRFDKAKVGAKYGEKTEIPKIVFVGLEGLNGHQGIERTETDKCYNPPLQRRKICFGVFIKSIYWQGTTGQRVKKLS